MYSEGMTPTDPAIIVPLAALAIVVLIVTGGIEWAARRFPRVQGWIERAIEKVLG